MESSIIKCFSEKLGYKPHERFSLSFDAIKFAPGLQRTSLNGTFYGFTTNYFLQGQIEIQKVINKGLNQESFLEYCCQNSYLGDYVFCFFYILEKNKKSCFKETFSMRLVYC